MKKLILWLGSFALATGINAQTTTFNFTGGLQTYTVPVGVTSITVDVKGAQGGFGYNCPAAVPGLGGRVTATVPVTPGEVLNIWVGGQGGPGGTTIGGTAGFNGGGTGGGWSGGRSGGGGGGASDIRQSGNALANRVVVGAGGGGTGVNYSTGNAGGNGGGLNGTNGLTGSYLGGGASQVAGGTPNGVFGVGGNAPAGQTGGGGGGGYYGGGGSAWEGGGGGSSYAGGTLSLVTHTGGFQSGNGQIIITAVAPGAALNFDGANDFVSVPASPALNALGSGFTLEAWVNPSNVAPAISIIRKTGDYNMYIAGGTLRAEVWPISGNPAVNFYTGTTAIATGVWTHVAIVWNGATCVQYVNGVLDPNSLTSGSIAGSENMFIGISSLFGNPFVGSMDEVRVWNRALCQSEIQNNRTCEIATTGTGLVTNYHFNHGTAGANNAGITTLVDATGNGHSGTLSNFTLNGASSNWIAPGGVTSGVSCGAFVAPVVTVSAVSQTNISCFGGSNGAASVSASGGSGFSYNWTPGNPTGDGTASVTGLTAGTWTCTVTNNCGGVGTRTFNITAPTAIVVTPAAQTNVSCFGGSSGAASINTPTGGAGGYTYNWTPGNPTGDGTVSVTGLTAGTWTCTVTDANSCVATRTFNITAPTALVVTPASQTNISCNGGSNGAASINTPTGGVGGYTYNWTPGNPTGDGTASATGLTAGTWTCTVTDANSCVASQTFNITAPTAIVVTPATQTNVSCFGGSNGAASINTPTGGAGGYTYNWTPGNPTGDGTASATGLTAGTWTCTVTDANSCVASQTFNITAPTAIVVTPASQTNISCNGGSNGAASINTPTGGVGGYTYNWTPGNPTGDGTASATGLTAGTWTCTVTDANSCVATQTFNITAPSALVATAASQTNVSCFGGSNGAASVSVTGGTTSYTYDWTPGSPTGDGTASVTGLTAGTWTCTVTDANSCVTTQTFNLTAPSALVVSSSASSVACNGGNATVTVVATGGTAPYTGAGTFTVTAGTYSYPVTDANGCTNTTTITVTEPTALAASSSATSIACNGGTATVTVSATGGTSPYSGTGTFTVTAGTYSYPVTDANGCTNTTTITVTEPTALSASSSATSIACNGGNATVTVVATGGTSPYTGTGTFTVTAGTYSYPVTDANGCTNTTTITVTEPTALSASSSATSIACFGGNATVTVVATGGTAPYSGDGTFTQVAGTYTYTVTDANGCTTTTSITVTEPTALAASSSATSTACFGGNATVTVAASGGTAPYTGDGTFTEVAGTYTYTVTDANGCTTTTSITVTEPTALAATSSATSIACFGGNATVTVATTGGTAPYTGDGTFTEVAGTYTYTVTDANGCTTTTSITITEPAVLSAIVTTVTDPSSCGGTDGAIDITPAGGTIPYTFLWSNAATTEDLSAIGAGAYTCTITDANGCTTTAGGNLNDPNAPTVTFTLPMDTVCVDDGAFVLAGESPAGGTFSGTGVTAGSFDPTTAGVGTHAISYTFTDINGCTGSTVDSIYVDICLGSQFDVQGSQFTIYPNPNNGTFTLQLNNTTADVMIYDAQGKLVRTQKVNSNNEQITIAESGMYMITVITADGLQSSQRVIVTE